MSMCGRYTFTKVDEFGRRYGLLKVPSRLADNYNVAPTQTMPVIVNFSDEHEVAMMRWGIPRFIGPGKVKNVFNTRADKAFHNWKKLTMTQRVLVPATGFYEWQTQPGGKQPFFIHPKDEELFSFAGIWNRWKNEDGQEVDVYSIITTEPNDQMIPIHNRMPVILDRDDEGAWLSHDNDNNQELLESLLIPYKNNGLELFEVSKEVNVTSNNNAELLYPLNSA